jgi:hypothetical protein
MKSTLKSLAARISTLDAQLAEQARELNAYRATEEAAAACHEELTTRDPGGAFRHYPGLGLAKRVSGPTEHPVVKGSLVTREGTELFVQGYFDDNAWTFTFKEFGTWKQIAEVKASARSEDEFTGPISLDGKAYVLRCRYGITKTQGNHALKLKLDDANRSTNSVTLKHGFPVGKAV